MGGDPPHGAYPVGITPPGEEEYHGKNPKMAAGWGMGLTFDIGGHVGGGDRGYRGLHWEAAEHGGSVHSNQDHNGPMPGVGEAPWG